MSKNKAFRHVENLYIKKNLFIQVFVFIVQARYWLYSKNKHLDE